jgi:hypothetical protein
MLCLQLYYMLMNKDGCKRLQRGLPIDQLTPVSELNSTTNPKMLWWAWCPNEEADGTHNLLTQLTSGLVAEAGAEISAVCGVEETSVSVKAIGLNEVGTPAVVDAEVPKEIFRSISQIDFMQPLKNGTPSEQIAAELDTAIRVSATDCHAHYSSASLSSPCC